MFKLNKCYHLHPHLKKPRDVQPKLVTVFKVPQGAVYLLARVLG